MAGNPDPDALARAVVQLSMADLEVGVAAAKVIADAADTGDGELRVVYTACRRACVDAGAPAALVAFAGREDVKRSAEAARWAGEALRNMARADEGYSAFMAADVAQALVGLLESDSVKHNAEAARWVAWGPQQHRLPRPRPGRVRDRRRRARARSALSRASRAQQRGSGAVRSMGLL